MVSSAPTSPSVLMGGPPCCTWVMMLEAPPAAAIMYVKDRRGLESSSEYAGGGSASSSLLRELPSAFVSRGRESFVSATVSWKEAEGSEEPEAAGGS